MESQKVTVGELRALKGSGQLAALTVYDYPTARLLDEAGIPLLLVGDSLGMVVLGYEDTTAVTLRDMVHHVQAVARARTKALLAADLPFGCCENPVSAVASARSLVAAGAEAVKAEGGREILEQIQAIVESGIPFLAHLGMLPQRVREERGYRIKGRTAAEREALLADAQAVVDGGAFAVVLELVDPPVAREITESVPIPTIGIGSGTGCDGQILVTHDLIGAFPWFTPKHVRPRAQVGRAIREAAKGWREDLGRA